MSQDNPVNIAFSAPVSKSETEDFQMLRISGAHRRTSASDRASASLELEQRSASWAVFSASCIDMLRMARRTIGIDAGGMLNS